MAAGEAAEAVAAGTSCVLSFAFTPTATGTRTAQFTIIDTAANRWSLAAGTLQSQLTACGGFTVITAGVRNVNLPNGTVLWVTLGGEPIGRITLSGGAGSMAP